MSETGRQNAAAAGFGDSAASEKISVKQLLLPFANIAWFVAEGFAMKRREAVSCSGTLVSECTPQAELII